MGIQINGLVELYSSENKKKIPPERMELIDEVIYSMIQVGRNQNYIDTVRMHLTHWFVYLALYMPEKAIEDITKADVRKYIIYCRSNSNGNIANSACAVNNRITAISVLYNYLIQNGRATEKPTIGLLDRSPQRNEEKYSNVTILSKTDIAKIYRYLDKTEFVQKGLMKIQYKVFIHLILSTMIRSNEIENLRWEHINFGQRSCMVTSSRDYTSKVYFDKETQKLLELMKKRRERDGIKDDGYVFIPISKYLAEKGEIKLTRENFLTWTRNVGEKSGVGRFTPNDLRETSKKMLINSGEFTDEELAYLLRRKYNNSYIRFPELKEIKISNRKDSILKLTASDYEKAGFSTKKKKGKNKTNKEL